MTDRGQTQDSSSKGQQVGSAGGDVRQMKVGDFINIAAQNDMDVEALNQLVGDVQAAIEAGNVNVE